MDSISLFATSQEPSFMIGPNIFQNSELQIIALLSYFIINTGKPFGFKH